MCRAASWRALRTFPASPSFRVSRSGLSLRGAGSGAHTAARTSLPAAFQGPASARQRCCPDPRGSVPERYQIGLCRVSRQRGATCTSPAAGASRKTRRGGGPGEEQRKAVRLDLFARDGCRARGSPTGVGRSHRSPTSSPRRPRPVGWRTARRRGGSWCSRARGAPRCGPERGSPHWREQKQPGAEWPVRPAERACVRGQRAPCASRFCWASWLNFSRRD